VTGRTRVALGLMQKSIPCQLQIRRIVVDDTNSTKATGTDPLNWSLTPLQRWEVQNSADNVPKSYAASKVWFYGSSEGVNWIDAHLVDDWPCAGTGKAKDAAKKVAAFIAIGPFVGQRVPATPGPGRAARVCARWSR
jgi:hypothetical protein